MCYTHAVDPICCSPGIGRNAASTVAHVGLFVDTINAYCARRLLPDIPDDAPPSVACGSFLCLRAASGASRDVYALAGALPGGSLRAQPWRVRSTLSRRVSCGVVWQPGSRRGGAARGGRIRPSDSAGALLSSTLGAKSWLRLRWASRGAPRADAVSSSPTSPTI